MTNTTTLIIPGYCGSEDAHWQSWFEAQIPGSKRIHQNWELPVLENWATNIGRTLTDLSSPAWLIAHSFGCLTAILAAVENPEKAAGLMLVAPADPERFDQTAPSLLIASDNDPWMQTSKARLWEDCWGSRMFTLKNARHINTASGFGPWPDGLKLFKHFKDHSQGYSRTAKPPVFKENSALIQINDNQSTFSYFTA